MAFCGLGDLKKIEKVQLKGLPFISNDFRASYSDLRSRAGRPLSYIFKAIVTEVT